MPPPSSPRLPLHRARPRRLPPSDGRSCRRSDRAAPSWRPAVSGARRRRLSTQRCPGRVRKSAGGGRRTDRRRTDRRPRALWILMIRPSAFAASVSEAACSSSSCGLWTSAGDRDRRCSARTGEQRPFETRRSRSPVRGLPVLERGDRRGRRLLLRLEARQDCCPRVRPPGAGLIDLRLLRP